MRESPLPPEWQCLEGKVNYVQRVSSKEVSCSCPTCGGSVHQSGELPDRCRLFIDDHPTLFCRRCGLVAYPDQFGDGHWTPPTPQELETFRQKREESEAARLRSAERALAHLRDTKLWEQYAEMSGERGRQWWEAQGIPYPFQVIWSLGFDYDLARWGCASATIPLFNQAGECLNVKHRLLDESKGKYRYNVVGQNAPLFLCEPEADMGGHIVAAEGEKKAMVAYITLDDPHACIVGLPGLSPSQSIIDTLSKAERVTLILDPDSDVPGADGWSPAGRLVKSIGRRSTSLLIPPGKIDDGLLASRSDRWDMRRLLRQAVEM